MRWDFGQLMEGIEEFQRRSQRTQKSLADGSVGGATLLGSPVPPQLGGVPGVGIVEAQGVTEGGGSMFLARGPDVSGLQTIPPSTSQQKVDYENVIIASDHVSLVGGEVGTYEVQPGLYVASLTLQWYVLPNDSGRVVVGISVPDNESVETARTIGADTGESESPWNCSAPFAVESADWVHAYVVYDGTGDAEINRQVGGLRILRTGDLPA